jgi:diguanylate cyclase (GGDEF)-like protein
MANKSLQKQSQTDPLTGMYNRARLNEYGDVAFDRAIKNGVGIAIEILDIDFFKEYNDNYGHQKGDNVIMTAFGAGFVHGASYYKWAYDGASTK